MVKFLNMELKALTWTKFFLWWENLKVFEKFHGSSFSRICFYIFLLGFIFMKMKFGQILAQLKKTVSNLFFVLL